MDETTPPPLVILSRQDLTALMAFGEYVEAVADAFRMQAEGHAIAPAPMHVPTEGGGFHVKAGRLPIGPGYAAFKVNANLPDNRAKHGLPTIQGAILLFDATTGAPVRCSVISIESMSATGEPVAASNSRIAPWIVGSPCFARLSGRLPLTLKAA